MHRSLKMPVRSDIAGEEARTGKGRTRNMDTGLAL